MSPGRVQLGVPIGRCIVHYGIMGVVLYKGGTWKGHGVQHCDASVEYEGQITIAKQTLQPKHTAQTQPRTKSKVLSGYRLDRECLGG